jgi:hypothetical protein
MLNKHLSIEELFELRGKMLLEGKNTSEISDLILEKESQYLNYINEDTGTGGPSGAAGAATVGYGGNGVGYANATTAGMGSVVSPQPSMFAGVTVEPGFSAGGGQVGSGDISVPYNPGGRKKVFQKISADNRKGTNKRRKNKMIQGLKNIFSQKQDYTAGQGGSKPSKIMNFDSFSKEDLNKVTKVKE